MYSTKGGNAVKTTIKYAHGKGFSKNLASVTVLAGPGISREVQENSKNTRPQRHLNGRAHQLF